MRKVIFWGGAFFLLIITGSAFAAQVNVPNAHLRIGVKQKEDGKISEGIHIMELLCWNGQCSLTTASLNQCGDSGSGNAFYPLVQRSSTIEGNLNVENNGSALIVKEMGSDVGGEYTNNFQFQYQAVDKGQVITKLTGFSGGFVKKSSILNKIITIDYVPYPKATQLDRLDCNVLVPGIDS